ncbi:hypothetical protein VNO77_12180 [Canavalia gladiata]|uniref:Uncharacterized protein n=1 Tax=Canavalia gladiata TaxID=3824 RepID=A0AAN9LVZ6_CANGL
MRVFRVITASAESSSIHPPPVNVIIINAYWAVCLTPHFQFCPHVTVFYCLPHSHILLPHALKQRLQGKRVMIEEAFGNGWSGKSSDFKSEI